MVIHAHLVRAAGRVQCSQSIRIHRSYATFDVGEPDVQELLVNWFWLFTVSVILNSSGAPQS